MSNASDVIQRMRTQQRNAVQKTGRRTLFNPSPEPVEFKYSGDSYIIPPNGPGKLPNDTKVKNYNGELEVFDIYGIDPKQAQQARIAKKAALKNNTVFSMPKKLVISSLDIVDHAVKKLANRGVVCLTDNQDENEELRRQAAEAFEAFRLEECEQILARYDARKAVFYSQPRNADQPPPLMTERETAAAVYQAQWKLGQTSNVHRFVCPAHQCGFQHEERDYVVSHIDAFHPENSTALHEALPEALKEKPAKRGPGRPKKSEEAVA
jgi:hypothetical protein